MNCDDFSQRMHERLDRRRTLDSDDELWAHGRQCESCRAQMDAWRQIASIMPSAVELPTHDAPKGDVLTSGVRRNHSLGKTLSALAGLAAALLIAVFVSWDDSHTNPTVVADAAAVDQGETVLAQASDEIDPALWWRSVQDRDWVGQTMPMVKSVQEGVAPIGRSLMRAVTMLTIGGREQTS